MLARCPNKAVAPDAPLASELRAVKGMSDQQLTENAADTPIRAKLTQNCKVNN